ncbi:(+)-delta-cadinene synthase isozyme XC14-like [Durio zibethinus]|uniref:(+)-delta-cadinene synthase n=1 Tax=Durio zibethinus TaxID=66656 RepID=A0A6P5Y2M0_DURZI|nr:(+)-delta-cadinene synthase isozyme XC14-like [Durio zibethinus]
MSSQISANPVSTHGDNMSNENRHLAKFIPHFWGDFFLSCLSEMDMDARTQLQYEESKQEVRRMLATTMDKPSQKLHLIDVVQRLGVAYHFEKEIEDALQKIYHVDCNNIEGDNDDDDIYTMSIRFRLLREHGFKVHCESFNKLKDEKGNFKESLIGNVKGLLELYEAAHLRVHGENILEEALAFTTSHLKLVETMVDYPLSKQAANALKQPLRKSFPRLVARSYISIYEVYGTEDEYLMKFAKLDFLMVQHFHKKELSVIYRWWKGLDVAKNFPFIRERLVECYLWILGVYFEPHYSLARTFLTKVTALASILDDIYDAYGTHEELEIFTKAIHRWDINCIDQLPDYMKLFYSELLNVYKEMEDLMAKEGKLYRIQLAKEAMKDQCQACYVEAKWLHENYTPTLEEYMSIALVSCAYRMLTIASFVVMEDTITKETFIWAFNNPKILRASTIICRLMNDIASHKFEQERGHSPSAVECYMKQYKVSEQVAYNELNKQIKDAWKDINEEFLKPTAVPVAALNRILNLTRVLELIYKDEDAYTLVGEAVKTSINSLLIDPIPI